MTYILYSPYEECELTYNNEHPSGTLRMKMTCRTTHVATVVTTIASSKKQRYVKLQSPTTISHRIPHRALSDRQTSRPYLAVWHTVTDRRVSLHTLFSSLTNSVFPAFVLTFILKIKPGVLFHIRLVRKWPDWRQIMAKLKLPSNRKYWMRLRLARLNIKVRSYTFRLRM